MRNLYDDKFYKNRNEQTYYAANTVLSLLFKHFEMHSAIDFGCGVGTWLAEFLKLGGEEVKGLDGAYVNEDYLVIPRDAFFPTDLSKAVQLDGRKYDLAICLEVAEHLPISRAESFVRDICAASDLVLFSAATYRQGGDGHVNEQRLSYWKNIFELNDYVMLDMVRPAIWNDTKIKWWYRQNMAVFLSADEAKREELLRFKPVIVDMIHPDIYEEIRSHFWKIKNNRFMSRLAERFFEKK